MFRKLQVWKRITRIIDWLPVLWRDVDYDATSVYPFLQKKLERLEPIIRNGHAVSSEKSADEIKVAIHLLRRVNSRDYVTNACWWVDQKWGDFVKHTTKEEHIEGLGSVYICKEIPAYPMPEAEFKQAIKQQRKAHLHSRYMEKQDEAYFWKHFIRHYKRWWD